MTLRTKPAAGETRPAWRRARDPAAIAAALLAGERPALARAITLVESTRADDRDLAEALLALALPHTGGAMRIGVTGTPGVGKSTFIEAFGRHLTAAGHRVAVLAVDPSSARSGGSILGDKTRMTDLARDPAAFIRPSPAGGTLGGVARRTREAMLLVEAAGFDVVLVETVGVGQSETAVADMVDLFLLLLAPGGGDELQGIKRGIMELADLVVVNKADGELLKPARLAAADYRAALHLMRPKSPAWSARVLLASAVEQSGMAEVWEAIAEHRRALEAAGELGRRRAEQAKAWLWSELSEGLAAGFRQHPAVAAELPALEAAVADGRLAPSAAARSLLVRFLGDADAL
ncbi:MAG TPA: methylmalonyl Co-A mutase-associated GTPase MeaB [Candidatus Sulfotelmatobacter sp.]|nr:methylmalonyl Co-A mutase-associated GTPase MeaB [Candidatus Sulfotelmatobacter sp.]